ncbi:hypothetical protein AK88_01419 [Plasmodium fragile]|uniref:RRM domain-containing protein n=1 Tax=Plasmodium fragile TaxID=5857 RepID=A0A0D9QP97_PLAFR|nr:uncharacterized protein AK88_01419 [Plasmodium fragile]KJP88925.1 hypothetical protein AK88_01419 [Plasmodium fragile]
MSLNFSIANVVYVKNLSTDVTEKDIKEKFESCDEIIGVVFKNFPGKNQKYCQIEFKSSEGITKASRLNGELLLNVPMVVTVIEPISHNTPFADPAIGNNETDKNLATSIDVRTGALVNSAAAQSVQYQALQNILLQQQLLSEQNKGLVDFQNTLNEKNNKFDVFSKIIYMENVPEHCSEDDIKALFKNVGTTTSYKLQYNEQKKVHTAFVEFANEEHAKAALHLNGTKIGANDIIIRDAFSLINERGHLKNNFPLYSNSTNVTSNKGEVSDPPPAKKPLVVNEKVEKVLALRDKLSQKLIAMYNSSAVIVNNLGQVNPQVMGLPAEGLAGVAAGMAGMAVGVTQGATCALIPGAAPHIDQAKAVGESNNGSIIRTGETNLSEDKQKADRKKKGTLEGENAEEGEEDKDVERDTNDEDETQNKVRKGKKSRSGKYSSSESSSSSRSSSYSSSSSRSSYRRHGSKTDSRRKHSHRKHSTSTRKRKKYDSRSRSSHRTRSNDSLSSYESHKRSSYRERESKIRKMRKRYHSSSVSHSNSSHSPTRRRKRSSSNKPWWVKESEKMEMRQRLKERQRREMAYRDRYRR